MKTYSVTGMSCAACSARVEKAVSETSGVDRCSVNLLTNSMIVEGTADDKEIIGAVEAAGYKASPEGDKTKKVKEDALADKETPLLIKRLIFSSVFLLMLMYFSMGHSMFSLPLPQLLADNALAIALVQMVLCLIVMIINKKFFISGIKGVVHKAPNMDTLVAMGSGASFIWSVAVTFAIMKNGNMHLLHELYYESAAMILTLITVGKTLEAKSKGRTTDALRGLMDLRAKTARLISDGKETVIPAEDVKIGDVFAVYPGESVPADAVVTRGYSAVDESALTGESIPVEKQAGDRVSASTVNQSGLLYCRAVAVGEDTAISQIIKMVSDASATKAPIAKIADKVSGVFVPTVIIIAVITAVVWAVAGEGVAFILARAISVLVISCPCALGLATPVAIMVSSGVGAKNGILFKTAEAIEKAGRIQIVVLDKTGTITKGEPYVTDVIPGEVSDENELLSYAFSLEGNSEHPLAKAVVRHCEGADISAFPIDNFSAVPGKGIEAEKDGVKLYGGNRNYIESVCPVPEKIKAEIEKFTNQGKTPLLFSSSDRFLGAVLVADVIKEDSAAAIKEMKNMGIHVVMLTGDNENTAKVIGEQVGVDEVIAGVLPEGKEKVIRTLQKKGVTAMVGDGINDAPALMRADIGIAIGAGTDIAIDSADVVLMKSRLSDVPALLRLSRHTLKTIHQNLFWAFFYNALGIPLAAGVWIPVFGWTLNPMFGAAAMSLSSFCVVTNALRINLADICSPKCDRKIRKKLIADGVPEADAPKDGEFVINVEGMMCEHCEKRVRDTLEAFPEIENAEPDYISGRVRLTLSGEADLKKIRKAISAVGYKMK